MLNRAVRLLECCTVTLVICAFTGCCEKAVEAECNPMKASLESIKLELATARSEIESVRSALAASQAEVKKLKQTARYFFDVAVSEMSASDDDAGDNDAIKAFQEVIDRFPGDLLAAEAHRKTEALQQRISGRAKALTKAQSKVRRLIKICQSSARKAERISEGGLRFNAYNQIDMNQAMASERRAEPLRKKAQKAKEQAEELLETVPDPDGKLKALVEDCDET